MNKQEKFSDKLPLLSGTIDLSLFKGYHTEVVGENNIATLNINGSERINGEYTLPVYQDRVLMVGEVSIQNMGTIPDDVRIDIKLFTNKIDKDIISNLRMSLFVVPNKGKLYQTGKTSKGDSRVSEVGICSVAFTDDHKREDKPNPNSKDSGEYVDDNLPLSRL